jgi:hypothetical protein
MRGLDPRIHVFGATAKTGMAGTSPAMTSSTSSEDALSAVPRRGMGPKPWLVYALATTILWGVWGAFTGLPEERGFPETLVYCVWSLTMLPPALYALARADWQLEAVRWCCSMP